MRSGLTDIAPLFFRTFSLRIDNEGERLSIASARFGMADF